MAYTINNSIKYSQAFIGNLNPTVFTGSEPALTTANTIVAGMQNAPFTWPWNRNTTTKAITNGGGQDYTVTATDFGFLEKCTVTYVSGGQTLQYELPDVMNTKSLSLTGNTGRPQAVAVQGYIPGTSFTLRFGSIPDQNYTATLIYQKKPFTFTATTQDWFADAGIPYSYIDIFNSLFLSEMFQFAADTDRAIVYRQRGMAALLSKAEGLTEMQKNVIMGQWLDDGVQRLVASLKAQQAQQARVV